MGRPAVVPPAGRGRGIGWAPLPGRWGDAGGALSPKAPREGVDPEDSVPTGRGAAQRAATAGKGRGRRVGGCRPSCECQ